MNQVLKDRVYRMGTQKQVDYISKIGGMNEEEYNVFNLIHHGYTDLYIQEELNLSRKSYDRIIESVRAKLLLAVFECINYKIDKEDEGL